MAAQFNAIDFEQAAVGYFRDIAETAFETLPPGFKLSKFALARAKELRAEGDISTAPTPSPPWTAEDYESVAERLEREGNHPLASDARACAVAIRLGITPPEQNEQEPGDK